MGLLALQRLMSVRRELKRRRRRILARNGSIARVNKRKSSPFQPLADGDFQHGETSRYSIPYLPEDLCRDILALMPMRDAAGAGCLSRTFLRSWRCYPDLTLNWKTLYSKAHAGDLSYKVDSILRNRSGIGLKKLKLNLADEDSTFPYIDSWLQVAVTPGIEELTLWLYKKYNLPC